MIRVRVEGAATPGAVVSLDEDSAHHLRRVLRVSAGAALELLDGAGGAWEAQVVALEPTLDVRVLALRPDPVAAPAVAALEVWLPLLKGGRTDDLVRQLTELGARRIVPFAGSRSVVRLRGQRLAERAQRWRRIAAEATRQCGRTDVPEVAPAPGLPDEGPGVFFWEGASAEELARDVLCSAFGEGGTARVLVGPEGGLDLTEVVHLQQAGWRAAWLGSRVLRAETAVVVAATLALHALGEGGY